MSILLLFAVATSHATEFEVGAGFEFAGAAAPGMANAAIGQAELDGRLGVGPMGFRVDLDLVGPGPYGGTERVKQSQLTVFPEWAAAIIGTKTGWMIATGFQPHPIHNESQDPWNNSFVPYSYGMAELWPGYFLGLRAQAAFADGYLVTSMWGGAESGEGLEVGAPLLGGSLTLGRVEKIRAKASLTLFPTELEALGAASIYAPIGEAVALGGDVYLGFGGGVRASLIGTFELFPSYWVSPVARGEWTSGLAAPWVVDAGVAMQPFDPLRIVFTGRMDGGQPQGFLGVALFDDVKPGPSWEFR